MTGCVRLTDLRYAFFPTQGRASDPVLRGALHAGYPDQLPVVASVFGDGDYPYQGEDAVVTGQLSERSLSSIALPAISSGATRSKRYPPAFSWMLWG